MSGLYRPWDQDPRPRWRARVEYQVSGPPDDGYGDDLEKVLRDIGVVRRPAVLVADRAVVVRLLVRAEAREEAAYVAQRVVDLAHREAGHVLERLGIRACAVLVPEGAP